MTLVLRNVSWGLSTAEVFLVTPFKTLRTRAAEHEKNTRAHTRGGLRLNERRAEKKKEIKQLNNLGSYLVSWRSTYYTFSQPKVSNSQRR